jgi:hypothetical protein
MQSDKATKCLLDQLKDQTKFHKPKAVIHHQTKEIFKAYLIQQEINAYAKLM